MLQRHQNDLLSRMKESHRLKSLVMKTNRLSFKYKNIKNRSKDVEVLYWNFKCFIQMVTPEWTKENCLQKIDSW